MKDTLSTMKKSLSMYKSSLLPQEKPNKQKEIVLPLENLIYEPFPTPKFEFVENLLKFNMNEKKGQVSEPLVENLFIKSDSECKGEFVSVNDILFDDNEQIISSQNKGDFELYKKNVVLTDSKIENDFLLEKAGSLSTNKNNNDPFNIKYENTLPITHKEFLKIDQTSDTIHNVKQDNPLTSKINEYIPCNIAKSEEKTLISPLESNKFNFIDTNVNKFYFTI